MINKFFLTFISLIIFQLSNAQFFSDNKDVIKFNGFFDYYYDHKEDKIFLEVNKIMDMDYNYCRNYYLGPNALRKRGGH